MARYKLTLSELTSMVDRFLSAADATMAAAEETGNTAHIIPATRAAFVRYWRKHGTPIEQQISASMVSNWMLDADKDAVHQQYAEQVARIDEAGANYYERIALINPKLQQLAQLGLKQAVYGGYKDKPDNNVVVNISNKGTKIDWGK